MNQLVNNIANRLSLRHPQRQSLEILERICVQCPECNYVMPRDINGALNIMIRALQATAFTVSGDAITIRVEQ